MDLSRSRLLAIKRNLLPLVCSMEPLNWQMAVEPAKIADTIIAGPSASAATYNTFIATHQFTVMSALLFITAILIFLIGLVSEQITNLLFTTRPQR
ncbi:MAG: hypothetical protein ACRETA_01860 [Gammaproteobacteria bacterium]